MDAETSRPRKPINRTLSEFSTRSGAEETLLRCAAAGTWAKIQDQAPEERTEANIVRAEFIRFLALGGDDDAPVHERGLFLTGGLDRRR